MSFDADPEAKGMEPEEREDECVRCVLRRADDAAIRFDPNGVCNHCHTYDAFVEARSRAMGRASLDGIADAIKRAGRGRDYDCVLGVSGGVDSSYVAYIAHGLGLRPLAVHLDNGWDSELAVSNIERLLKKLDFDLYTYVISWSEFRDLQLAYLRASVVDIEAITDHAITACLYRVAWRRGIRYILTGANITTEGFLPQAWVHNKNDLLNIRAIHRKFATVPLRTFPRLGVMRQLFYDHVVGIRMVPVLDYVRYVKSEAKETLAEKVGWRDYGGKHHESVFTRFYQVYILPRKFGIDKRRSHLSTLICAGQLTRQEAIKELEQEPTDAERLAADKEFVLKKLGLSEAEFEGIMRTPARSHLEFSSHLRIYRALKPMLRAYKRLRYWSGTRLSGCGRP